jgi:uncharacterized BrkB/YihY/UPF0761 family membrane protein
MLERVQNPDSKAPDSGTRPNRPNPGTGTGPGTAIDAGVTGAPGTDSGEPSTGTSPGTSPAEEPTMRARLVTRARSFEDELKARRRDSLSIDAAFRAIDIEAETGGGVLAGAVAFRVFLFMIPYVFFLLVGFGVAAEVAATDPADMARQAGIGGLAASGVANAADLSGTSRLVAFILSGFAVLWGARVLAKVLWVTHELIWRTRRRMASATRSALGIVALVTGALAIAEVMARLRERSLVLAVLSLIVFTVVPFGVWLFVSWRLPHADCPWWALMPGAALFGVGTSLLHILTVTYLVYLMASKSETYGVIGVSLALLFWAYMLGRIVTASAVLNTAFWNRYATRHHLTAAPIAEQWFSAADSPATEA